MREMVSAYLGFEERIAPNAQIFLEQSITGQQVGHAGSRRKL
jgi:hypothetical protein